MGRGFAEYGEEGNRLIHGDALEVLEVLEEESVDLIFVDPPYNIGKRFGESEDRWPSDEAYMAWCRVWLERCIRLLRGSGTMYVMASTQCMPYFDLFLRERMKILSRIVWHYDSSGVQAKRYFGSLYEPILHCVKDAKAYTFCAEDILVEAKTGAKRKLIDYRGSTPRPYNTKKVPGNVWTFPRVRYRMAEYETHPTQKPQALLERVIRASSREGDVVLDPFSGSFTTCAVAQALGRASIGIEREEEYVKIGLRRLGLQDEFEGERLEKPPKRTRRKNSRRQLAKVDKGQQQR